MCGGSRCSNSRKLARVLLSILLFLTCWNMRWSSTVSTPVSPAAWESQRVGISIGSSTTRSRSGRQGLGGGSSGIWQASERGIFLGEQHSKSLAIICPALQEHVAGKLRDSAALLKQRRKAKEERDASRGGPLPGNEKNRKKKNNRQGKDDQGDAGGGG